MNKRIFCTFFFSAMIILSVYSQSDTVWNQQNSAGKKEGLWRAYHSNGILRYKGKFNNGKPTGDFYLYLNNGDLKTILSYKSERVAYGKHFYSTGNVLAQGKYVEKEKDSIWITYGAKNIKLEEGSYAMGKKTGPWIVYFTNGKVAERKVYENDVEQGKYQIFYSNGQLKQEAKFKNGTLEGETNFYDREGEKTLEGKYNNNMRVDNWTYYDDEGAKIILKYKNGELLNPKDQKDIDYDVEEFRENIKDWLEFEDLRGNIKYEKPKEKR